MVAFTDELQRLPAQPISAVRVLRMVDDPNASTADLARLVETDPALSAQVLRMANSPYYGLSNTVGSAGRAVMLLGFTTVRALAVSSACGLLAGADSLFPPGFWPHAIATAVGASSVAGRAGVGAGEAFSAGLMHDIGTALLHRRDPDAYQRIVEKAADEPGALLALEREHFGATHAQVGAEVLRAWRLPPAFVRSVSDHHRPPDQLTDALSRVVAAGEALAACLEGAEHHEATADVSEALETAGVRSASPDDLLLEMRRDLVQLAWFLGIEQ
jgi:putative nucleotidyltransferase with HDIG domain